MFIRYHLFYFAIAALCLVLAKIIHPIFYCALFVYLCFIYQRLSFFYVVMMLILCTLLWFWSSHMESLPTTIEGYVVKESEKYCYLKTDEGIVKLYHQLDNIEYGDFLKVKQEPLDIYDASNDYAFSERHYLYGQKIFHKSFLKQLLSHQKSETFYHWIKDHLSTHQDVRDYQLLFVLGERSENIAEDYQLMTDLSLVHLFALSGMHIHILFAMLKGLLGLLLPRKLSRILTYLLIGFYIFSIPMLVSLYRAFFILLLYDLLKKWFNKLDIFALLVIASLFYNPYMIYNISFVFSYFVYFIVLLTHRFRYSALWIYLSTIPIILSLNAQIPLIAVFVGDILNLFIEYFYSLCLLSVFFPILENVVMIYVYVFQNVLSFLQVINHFIVFSKPPLAWIVIFYFIYFQMISRKELQQKIQHQISMLIALMIVLQIFGQYKIYGEVTMIDVGQGDCTFIRLPMNQGNILIDTGGTYDYDLAMQTIIPYLKSIGVSHLDYVYISHSDFDHSGALSSLVEHFSIGQVIDDYEANRQIGCARIQMLQTNKVYTDTNDQSLIMYVTLPAMNILFMGDASIQIENDLHEQFKELEVDILKVSHHGSATATSSYFLDAIQPEVAMIGVGKDNMYNHPSSQVIERLKRKGITILRTDEDGMFHIRFYRKERYILR